MKMMRNVGGKLATAAILLSSVLMARSSMGQQPAEERPAAHAGNKLVEARNKALVVSLYFHFFNNKEASFANQVISKNFIQHTPDIPTGRDAIVSLIQSLQQQFPDIRWDIDHIIADGDLVWLQTHESTGPGDPGNDIMDIYRVKNGVLVEHWDASQSVVTSTVNSNTQF